MRETLISVSVEPTWATVRSIRKRTGELLDEHPAELRMAAMLTASELLENAIKYGESIAQAPQIVFALTREGGVLQIGTRSGSTGGKRVEQLCTVVERLATAVDAEALYLARIREVSMAPGDETENGIGLYRIAVEGRFTLSCRYEDCVVHVLASRSVE